MTLKIGTHYCVGLIFPGRKGKPYIQQIWSNHLTRLPENNLITHQFVHTPSKCTLLCWVFISIDSLSTERVESLIFSRDCTNDDVKLNSDSA